MKRISTLVLLLLSLFQVGALAQTLPYDETFASEDAFKTFTVVDANGDGTTWIWDTNYSRVGYNYNSSNAADDWMITPAFHLEAGKTYLFSFKASNAYPQEKVRAAMGRAATAEAMTTELVPVTEVGPGSGIQVNPTVRVRIDETGDYYFGIQACSDKDMSELYLDEVALEEVNSDIPAVPENFTVVPGEKGAMQATLTFDVPSVLDNGKALESPVKMNIYRDGSLIDSLLSQAPGTKGVQYVDTKMFFAGAYTYEVAAVSGGAEGVKASADCYVGVDAPASIENVKVMESDAQDGTVTLSWDAPSKGQHGGYVDPAGLTYYVASGWNDFASNGSNTTYSEKLDISKGQTYQAWSIYAESAYGSGREYRVTVQSVAGPAKTLPFAESFPGITLKSGPWLTNMEQGAIGEAYWDIVDGTYYQSKTQDGDGGVAVFSASSAGKAARFETPKIDISSATKPELSFWYYDNGNQDILTVSVSTEHSAFQPVLKTVLKGDRKWQRVTVDLSEYKDSKFIQVGFTGVSINSTYDMVSIDNIKVTDYEGYNLAVSAFTAPTWINVGDEGQFTATITNLTGDVVNGGDYSLELLKNGKVATTVKGETIVADGQRTFTLTDEPTIKDAEESIYQVRLVCDKDQVATDNLSAEKKVNIMMPTYPAVTDLTGKLTAEGAALSWTALPESTEVTEPSTDDFEGYADFTISNVGDWTMVDQDKANTIQLTLSAEGGALQYDNAGKPMAFQVFNPTAAGISLRGWQAHSGSRMLVSFHCTDGTTTSIKSDDWAISPELSGRAQTIRFYAKNGYSGYPESLQVLVSTTTKDVAAFTAVGETLSIDDYNNWKEYMVKLPEGARYFALRCVSEGGIALFIDDVTYIAKGAETQSASLEGYNVYRDGELLNDELVSDPTYVDTTVEAGKTYNYQVTAVYEVGESVFSNVWTTTVTGISGISARKAQRVDYYDLQGRRVSPSYRGAVIVRSVDADGNVKTQKIMK